MNEMYLFTITDWHMICLCPGSNIAEQLDAVTMISPSATDTQTQDGLPFVPPLVVPTIGPGVSLPGVSSPSEDHKFIPEQCTSQTQGVLPKMESYPNTSQSQGVLSKMESYPNT